MKPTPLVVIGWVLVLLAGFAALCAWGVREDNARRWRRRPRFDCSGLVTSLQAMSAAAGAGAVAFSALGRSVIEVGVAFERAAENMRRALSVESDTLEAFRYAWDRALRREASEIEDRARHPFVHRGEGHVQFVGPDGLAHDAEYWSPRLPVTRDPDHPFWEHEAHRVAAIADAELEAWRAFIDGCGR